MTAEQDRHEGGGGQRGGRVAGACPRGAVDAVHPLLRSEVPPSLLVVIVVSFRYRYRRLAASMVASQARKPTSPPQFVAIRNAVSRAGASQIVAYHNVLVPG